MGDTYQGKFRKSCFSHCLTSGGLLLALLFSGSVVAEEPDASEAEQNLQSAELSESEREQYEAKRRAERTSRFALGVKAGTTGLGLEGTLSLSERFNLRLGASGFSYSDELEESDVQYDGDLDIRKANLLVDYHPFGGGFRLSAGGYYNGTEFTGSAVSDEIELGDNTYQGQLDAELTFDSFAPYVGVGYGNATYGGRLSFTVDLGVMYTGSPSVSLDGSTNANVPDAVEAHFEEDLRAEEQELQDEVDKFKYYPVANIGMAFRF